MLHTRIAPTPSGWLHRGNAFSFVLTWLYARASGGTVWLRIDDLDKSRRRREYIEDIFVSLRWLGLDWDRGPTDTDDFLQNHSQQLRLAQYQAVADKLRENGNLFACTCSRKAIRQRSPSGNYPGTCRSRNIPFDAPRTAWRINTTAAKNSTFQSLTDKVHTVNLDAVMPDFVVRQKNGQAAYMLASVVDDVRAGINFIVRGQDLYNASAAQSFLAAELAELRAFRAVRFLHHPLWRDEKGDKLSKSAGATALHSMREAGVPPTAIFHHVADFLGLPAQETAAGLLEAFRKA